jgi:hypothetical protein
MATRADEIVQLKAELDVLKEREQSEDNPTLKSELNRRIIETHRTMNLLLETQQGKCVAACFSVSFFCVHFLSTLFVSRSQHIPLRTRSLVQ